MERKGLGRGLSALMSDVALRPEAEGVRKAEGLVPVDRLRPNPQQPRVDFDPEALETLAASVAQKGVIQPLIVRPVPGAEGHFQIVAGERRWRAAQMARLHEVPVVIRDLDDTEALEVAIIENIQRADLNAIEEALGIRALIDRFGHTQEKVAEALSKSRSNVTNLLRLLSLPDEVQGLVREGKLSAGHARALIGTPDPLALARKIVAGQLSVREVERMVRALSAPKTEAKAPETRETDADTRVLEADLAAHLGMPVRIDHRGASGSGSVTISYADLDQLDRLCGALTSASAQLAR